jgi:membrane-bound lytic murein transglycosylase B
LILLRHKAISCLLSLCILSSFGIAAAESPSEHFKTLVNAYPGDKTDLSQLHPVEFNQLYAKVKDHFSREELKAVLSKTAAIQLDEFHMKRIVFVASPDSVRVQSQQHVDWVPKLVNDETLKKGVTFFQQHNATFKRAYQKTGVKPQDIIAILNWESRLGEQKGQYDIFKIFVGQAFYIDDIEKKLYREGAYNKEGAMPRDEALKRIERIKQRALTNLGETLIQSRKIGIDPYSIKGSWAGAIGIPQFMPASMGYAADGDGDGIIDLNTIPDSILSVSTYLQRNGYHSKGSKYAFKRYNQDEMYMRGVSLYSEEVEKRGVNNVSSWIYQENK